jgi:sec-independent protein translocase protein TatC
MVPVLDALPKGQQALIYTSALEKFFVYLRVAVYAGVFLSAPNVLYQLWRFVAPGLYRRERRLVLPFVVSGSIMFVAGAVFCYLVILPNAFEFLIAFGGAADWTRPMLSLKEQLSLVLMLELAFGVVFEIPLIIAFLSMIGVVQASWLARYRRHAAVVITFIAAVITPTGDPFNLALMAVPMYLFYEIGILLARVLGKRREELAEEEAAEASKS